ncbi:hypothetical protein GFJ94_03200 [Flavobacterium sp. LMO8]|uniref:hypothetical protein n=1 Tax=Flavobacterium sp. LMO8 TaxID=2654244 RepID=UPI001290DE8A|nr:hypothetical protein [Flavobacterium sp. LMO8]MQP24069.1 hypothetical protein [Flavobacterium sp. LMO8]
MKNLLILLVATLFFTSCKKSALNNSFIYFSEAQPTNVDAITEFPKKFVGSYAMDYSHRLVIAPKYICINEIETITALKAELDSIPEFELRNNQVFDKSENKSYKTFIKGDTVAFEVERLDTIFSFAENEIAKEYKSSLVLNKKVDENYVTSIIKVSSLGMKHIQLGTKKDFTKLKDELKIPFVTEMKENDTLHVVLTPSRADFRKLLRKEGFEYESNYLFK